MARKNLYLNGVNLSTLNIYISSDTYLNAPEIDFSEYEIPARDGSLMRYNKRLRNIERVFQCYIPKGYSVEAGITALKKILYIDTVGKYFKIASDYEPGYYQWGVFTGELSVEPFDKGKSCNFELVFSCLPQKYSDESLDVSTPTQNISLFDMKANVTMDYSSSNPIYMYIMDNTNIEWDENAFQWCRWSAKSEGIEPNENFNVTIESNTDKFCVVIIAGDWQYSNDWYSYAYFETETGELTIDFTNDSGQSLEPLVFAPELLGDTGELRFDITDLSLGFTYQHYATAQLYEVNNVIAVGTSPVLYVLFKCNLDNNLGDIENTLIILDDKVSVLFQFNENESNLGKIKAKAKEWNGSSGKQAVLIKINFETLTAEMLESTGTIDKNAKKLMNLGFLVKFYGDATLLQNNYKVGVYGQKYTFYIENDCALFNSMIITPNWWGL